MTEPENTTPDVTPEATPEADRNAAFYTDAIRNTYGVSAGEAEQVYATAGTDADAVKAEVDKLKDARVVYRQVYEQVDPRLGQAGSTPVRPPVSTLESGRPMSEIPGETKTTEVDPSQPGAGPYGPYASYPKTEVTDSEVADRTGLDPESGLPVSVTS